MLESHWQRLPTVSGGGGCRPACPLGLGKQAEEEEMLWTRLLYKLTRKIFGLSPIPPLPLLSNKKGPGGRHCGIAEAWPSPAPCLTSHVPHPEGRQEMPERPAKSLPGWAPRASVCGTRDTQLPNSRQGAFGSPGEALGAWGPRLLSARVPQLPHSFLWGWAIGPPRTFLP